MNFDELELKTIPFDEFELKWRFTEEEYNVLPESHLAEIKPLNKDAGVALGNLFFDTGLMGQYKLNPEHFNSIIEFDLRSKSEEEGRKWLSSLKIDSDQTIFLYWDSWGSATTNWMIFKTYYDDFFYPGSDDLILTDKKFSWILYFFHEEFIYFGNKL